jgi:hypothetical protein
MKPLRREVRWQASLRPMPLTCQRRPTLGL